MKAMHVCLFVICINLAFPLLAPTGIFNGIGPAGTSTSDINILSMVGVAGFVAMFVAGGIVIAGWTFKTSAVVTAFGAIYAASAALMLSIIAQMMAISGVPIPNTGVITGVLTTLYAFIGVWGVLQIGGTPTGIME